MLCDPFAFTTADAVGEADFQQELQALNVRCKVADYNFSGSVNVTDLLRLLGTWGSCPPPCDMDLDFNGTVNVDDLLTLLGDWGDCPPP